ncbi:MAG TPA: sodium:alanine symporter family protein [Bacteroidia bacterium]|nr:alanine:cation symporter family protein [Sphingobacteriales bacterium]HPD66018.1 sodium:alanine symporter family protein [Bacteroidia bacterium]HRS59682.1 sodium:alanine symporter family protein [Bacteroidia bacterium]HRU68603.1 sodium:alanine symporter family protein [Bacteroidia bacterium]
MNKILDTFDKILVGYNEYIGGYLILLVLIPTGIYYAFRLKFINIRKLGHAIAIVRGKYDNVHDDGDINHFKALTTALSATVGTGNIVGVSLAIYLGGPGALFWMWVTGFLGMIIKYVEVTLAHKFRKFNSDGTVAGGPMYYMEFALKDKLGRFAKVLAVVFAIAAILCSLGTGNMAQCNSIADVMLSNYNIPVWFSGLILTSLVFLIVIGGIKRIAEVTSRLVPVMAVFYFAAAILVIILDIRNIPNAFLIIFRDAFTGQAMGGGFVGSAFFMTMLWGVRRGLFSNEAGQGSAPIAHSAAKTKYPVREGLVALLEPFIDTIVICSLTGLVVVVSGAWSSNIKGVGMTVLGMSQGLSKIGLQMYAKHIVAFGLLMFAFSTVISWSYYGATAANYLLGEKARKPYYYLFCLFVFFGSVWGLDLVWHFVDAVITLMSIPNLIAILLLSPVIVKETKDYFEAMKMKKL